MKFSEAYFLCLVELYVIIVLEKHKYSLAYNFLLKTFNFIHNNILFLTYHLWLHRILSFKYNI